MTTLNEARMELEDIARWAPLLPASWSSTPIRSARGADGTTHAHLSYAPLPGGMEHAIDTWDQNGAIGLHTQIGIRQALGPWADELRGLRDALVGTDPPLGPIHYLLAHLDWARDHMATAQWDFMCADIHGVHSRVQQLACPPVEHSGTCPNCGTRLEWVIGSKGKINTPICPNHDCKVDMRAGLIHAQRARLKRADPDTDAPAYAPVSEIRRIWPRVKESTLRKWAQRGKIRKRGDWYCVTDIAPRLASSTPKDAA